MDKAPKTAVLGLARHWESIHREIVLYFSSITFLDDVAKTNEQYFFSFPFTWNFWNPPLFNPSGLHATN